MLGRLRYLALLALLCPAVARADDDSPPVVAHIRLTGSFDEAAPSTDPLFGSTSENFKAKLDRIKKARTDANVKGLYLQLDGLQVGWGKIDELTRAIADFRTSGKKVFAYVESGEAADYYLALACDEICVPEGGWLMIVGLRMEVTFYKELFDKIGVKADMLQMGDFKGAAEPFTRSSLSEPFKKQLLSLLDDRFDKGLGTRLASARKLSIEQVKKLIDEGPYTAKSALKAKLIDRVAYANAFEDSFKTTLKEEKLAITKNYGAAKSDDLDLSSLAGMMKLLSPSKPRKSKEPKVAVIYAAGAIVTGKSGISFLGGESCGSTTMIEAIRQAESDDTVKAIVLRVDSPGGSALASDLIWNELKRCKKPVIASMSDVAASGGYYISMAARKIYAEPGTITGSIGVVGGKLTLSGLYDKIGITTETLSRGANANIFSSTPFSESEKKAFLSMMRDTYDLFLDKAVEGRVKAGKDMTRAKLESLAGGRIWTGRQALANDLIDELGTLDDAVAAAWKMAGQPGDKEPELLQLPKPKNFLDMLMDMKSDVRMMAPEQRGASFRAMPELARKLGAVEALLQLRGEPVWLISPFCVEMK